MNAHPGTGSFGRAAGFAGSVTLAVAVAADVIAGGHPLHTATLALVTAVVTVMRLRLARRHGGLFAAVQGVIVAQPALHAAMKLLPAQGQPSSALGHTAVETSTTAVHVLVAAVIVAGVAGAEQLFLAVAALQPFTRWLSLPPWAPPRRQSPAPLGTPRPDLATRHPHLTQVPRRGPPATARAITV